MKAFACSNVLITLRGSDRYSVKNAESRRTCFYGADIVKVREEQTLSLLLCISDERILHCFFFCEHTHKVLLTFRLRFRCCQTDWSLIEKETLIFQSDILATDKKK